ncbi:hypothetical protein BJ508DRAFT_334997 [Ascobolus immersus RN42]|uniref:Uncharacterized protein n=1 Tax=Ascobolus immersus RN42 TaxID=1160509 RepID=A0A3N4HDB3_ASCIM|nr:hypothetical protein BJ508DRAFT_315454 [Ascobolus immersus RN42]RPA72511.1 hypothetical protein BJ508DRAFT_334997 [Ascobolus immersus RN42]
MGRPIGPIASPLQTKAQFGDEFVWHGPERIMHAIVRNFFIQCMIAVANAVGSHFNSPGRQGTYRIPIRLWDGLVYAAAPRTFDEIRLYTHAQWLELSAFYNMFDWENRTLRNGLPLPVEQIRAEWCWYAGIIGRFEAHEFEWIDDEEDVEHI